MNKYISSSIKAVLFDHDDTLVGTFKPKWAEHKYIAKKYYGKELSDKELHEHYGKPHGKLMELLYETKDIDQAIKYNLLTHKRFPKVLLKDTLETLKQLKEHGLKLGVITAAHSFSFYYDLESLGIPKDIFDYTQTEDNSTFHKPDPRVFDPAITWLKGMNIKANEVLYVGDGLHDMQAALGAGLEFIGVSTGLITQETFKSKGAISIKKLGDLIKV